MIYATLWQDVYFENVNADVLNYSVRTSDESGTTEYIIYKGKAYKQPGGIIQIKINPIIDKYMGNVLPENWWPNGSYGGYSIEGYTESFYLFNDDTETVLESYNFRYTYDEDFHWYAIPYDEIDNYIPDYTQYVTEEQYHQQYGNGLRLGCEVSGEDFTKRIINEIAPPSITGGYGNVMHYYAVGQFAFQTYIDITSGYRLGSFRNKIYRYSPEYANGCGDMAVYYLGRCGCWNDFLFTGVVKRTDEIKHYDYGTDGFNRKTGNPEYSATINRYANEIIIKYECTTGWLDDTSSKYFATDLVPALKVLVHDLKEDKIYPAIITDTEVETKQYKNNKEMNKYTVTFQIARDYYIR